MSLEFDMSMAAIPTVTCALIASSKPKREEFSRAEDLYLGGRFVLGRDLARKNDWLIMVLSAKYGLVSGRTHLYPYDESLADKTPQEIDAWAKRVEWTLSGIKNAVQITPRRYEFVVLAEDMYALPLRAQGIRAEYPLFGMNEERQKEYLKAALAA